MSAITVEELRAQNPELYELAFAAGVAAERQRVLDHLAMEGGDLCLLAVVRRAIASSGSLEDWLPVYERAASVLATDGVDPTRRVRKNCQLIRAGMLSVGSDRECL